MIDKIVIVAAVAVSFFGISTDKLFSWAWVNSSFWKLALLGVISAILTVFIYIYSAEELPVFIYVNF